MAKVQADRLAKTAAGDPAELNVNIITGNGTNLVELKAPPAGGYVAQPRDGLVSVIQLAQPSGSNLVPVDRTATASLQKGSLLPGADFQSDAVLVTWYHFEG
jgi:hypothetical protein